MEKRRSFKGFIITLVIVFSVITLNLLLVLGATVVYPLKDLPIDMYATMNECQKIETNKEENATVVCLTTNDDPYLKGLTPMQFYGYTYTSDTMTFKLFAYEFATTEDAAAFFENVTGKSKNPAVTFSRSSGLSTHRCIVMDHENVYCYISPKRFHNKVTTYVNDCFSGISVYSPST